MTESNEPSNKSSKPYTLEAFDDYTVVKFNERLSTEGAKLFEPEVLNYAKSKPDHHWIIDCTDLVVIPQAWVGSMLRLGNQIKTRQRKVCLISVSREVQTLLVQKALDRMLPIAPSLQQALVSLGKPPSATSKVDIGFITPILEESVKILKFQAELEVKAGKPAPMGLQENRVSDVTGVIGISSQSFSVVINLRFSQDFLLKLMSRILDIQATSIDPVVEVAVNDLMLTIVKQAKEVLKEKGYQIQSASPAVVTGTTHSMLNTIRGPRIEIPCYSNLGNFAFEICLSE